MVDDAVQRVLDRMAEFDEYLDHVRDCDDDDLGFDRGCNTCGGAGRIVTCIDDLCRGAGECIHGDGEEACPDCDAWMS